MAGMQMSEAMVAQAVEEALHATADPRLYPHLIADRDSWINDAPDEDLPPLLQSALARYAPTPEP